MPTGSSWPGAIHGLISFYSQAVSTPFSMFLWSGMHRAMASETPLSPLFRNEYSSISQCLPQPSCLHSPEQGELLLPLGLSTAATATTRPYTIVAIFIINTWSCCDPVGTKCVHCLAQSPKHYRGRIKYQVLSETGPEEKRPSLLYLWQTSPASVAQNGLTVPNTPSSLPGNLDQPPTTSYGIIAPRGERGAQHPSRVPGPVQLSTTEPALPREVELPSSGLGPLSERRQAGTYGTMNKP